MTRIEFFSRKNAIRLQVAAASLALLAIVGCSRSRDAAPPAAETTEPFRVALIANGPLTDFGFNQVMTKPRLCWEIASRCAALGTCQRRATRSGSCGA
jgi:hypothetical protein